MDTATYICPNCQQDALLKGAAQFVCISCGYSTAADDKTLRASAKKSDRLDAHLDVHKDKKTATSKTADRPVVESAGGQGPLVAAGLPEEEAGTKETMIQPERDNKVVIERKLSRVVGEKRIESAERQLNAVAEASKGFIATYHDELNELFGAGAIRFLKGAALLAGILVLAFMIYTFLR